MDAIELDITSYTVNAVSLFIIALASTVYLLRLKDTTPTARLMAFGLVSLALSMAAILLTGLPLWGAAISPLADAFSVVGMAAMVEFACRIPQAATSPASRLVRALTWGAGLLALALGLRFAGQILLLHDYTASLPAGYDYLNPATFLVALGVSVARTIAIQPARPPGLSGAVGAFLHPQDRPARLLRNFSLALSIGLVQGYVSGIGLPASFPTPLAPILINLSLLLMLAAMVYAAFDFPVRQPSLVVRLAGLTLVTTQALLGMIALYDAYHLGGWTRDQTLAQVEDARSALRAGLPEALPGGVAYVIEDSPNAGSRLLATRPAGLDQAALLASSPVAPVWGYNILGFLLPGAPAHGLEVRLRYGDHPPGSYYRYAGFAFDLEGSRYEVGFDLAELSRPARAQGAGMIAGVLSSSFVILFLLPWFFQANLIRPLERLLAGVRQADAGELDAQVAVTHNDEVGYLTSAFNKMTASLKRELDGRQSAEAELRRLNLTLERRVSERTRELEALYDVTAASSQTGDPHTLLAVLLERSLSALRSPAGFILLIDEQAAPGQLSLAASQALPPAWQPHLTTARLTEPWVTAVIERPEALLIANSHGDARTPAFMRSEDPLALVLAPLQAEGQVLGLLGMARAAQQNFDLDELALLVSLVNQVGVAVHTEALRQLVQQASVLEERQRLARDLHDSVTQSLYGLVTLSEVGLMRVEAQDLPASAETFARIGQSARQAIREMRLFIHQLRPSVLKQEGLAGALDLRLAAVEGRSDVRASLIADEDLHLPLPIETALYHIAQEALNNALKHASAANVTVTLARQGARQVRLSVVDDGRGFDPQAARGGMGLSNMHARAAEIGARLEIDAQPGQGTRVNVCLEVSP